LYINFIKYVFSYFFLFFRNFYFIQPLIRYIHRIHSNTLYYIRGKEIPLYQRISHLTIEKTALTIEKTALTIEKTALTIEKTALTIEKNIKMYLISFL